MGKVTIAVSQSDEGTVIRRQVLLSQPGEDSSIFAFCTFDHAAQCASWAGASKSSRNCTAGTAGAVQPAAVCFQPAVVRFSSASEALYTMGVTAVGSYAGDQFGMGRSAELPLPSRTLASSAERSIAASKPVRTFGSASYGWSDRWLTTTLRRLAQRYATSLEPAVVRVALVNSGARPPTASSFPARKSDAADAASS